MYSPPPTYAPEERRAIRTMRESLLESLPIFTLPIQNCLPSDVLLEGTKKFFKGFLKAKNLPKGDNWMWNQARRSQELLNFENQFNISFFKLNTRKSLRSEPTSFPSYKVWIFHLEPVHSNDIISFYWCERGTNQPILNQELFQQLSFLQPFMSPESSIRWYQKP